MHAPCGVYHRPASSTTQASLLSSRASPGVRQWRHSHRALAAKVEHEPVASTSSSSYQYGASTTQGPRPTMEDELQLEVDAKLGFTYAAIFDGHGGSMAAEWLGKELQSRIMARVDKSFLQSDPDSCPVDERAGVLCPGRATTVLREAFQQADAELLAYIEREKGAVTGASGATATVALIHRSKAIFASLGDSLAVLCRAGQPVRLTTQHRVYGVGQGALEEMERVEAAGGWIVDGRVCNVLAVSRAFGDLEFKGKGLKVLMAEGAEKGLWTSEFANNHTFKSDPVTAMPDVTEIELNPEQDEFLIIATDGLWDCMPPAEAIRFARQQFKSGRNADQVADAMCEIALKRYTTDNVAVIVVDMQGGPEGWKNMGSKSSAGSNGSSLKGMFGFLKR